MPATGDMSVTGNELGFYLEMPTTTILLLNDGAVNVTLDPLPSYAIEVDERMLLYTSLRELVGVGALMDHRDVDELHLVGAIKVYSRHRHERPVRCDHHLNRRGWSPWWDGW